MRGAAAARISNAGLKAAEGGGGDESLRTAAAAGGGRIREVPLGADVGVLGEYYSSSKSSNGDSKVIHKG
jgi:hypothetical protein